MTLRILTALFFLFSATRLTARESGVDTGKVLIPEITYLQFDSLTKSNEYTAIYFWPTWCVPCVKHVFELSELVKGKQSISLISINDASSKKYLYVNLINKSKEFKAFYRIEYLTPKNNAVRKFIQINDLEQIRLFNSHITKETLKRKNERSPAFFLFDRTGNLLWYNTTSLSVDEIAKALEKLAIN